MTADPLPPEDPIARYSACLRPVAPPPGFADRTLERVLADRRQVAYRRRIARFGGFALAASALLAVAVARPWRVEVPQHEVKQELAAVNLGDQWNEAGRSLESLTSASARSAVEPSKLLLASVEGVTLPDAAPEAGPPLDLDLGSPLAALEPVAAQPRRAVNAMLRDFGLAPPRK